MAVFICYFTFYKDASLATAVPLVPLPSPVTASENPRSSWALRAEKSPQAARTSLESRSDSIWKDTKGPSTAGFLKNNKQWDSIRTNIPLIHPIFRSPQLMNPWIRENISVLACHGRLFFQETLWVFQPWNLSTQQLRHFPTVTKRRDVLCPPVFPTAHGGVRCIKTVVVSMV